MPDTSPRRRRADVRSRYDLGQGAGFYRQCPRRRVGDATTRCHDYVTRELPRGSRAKLPALIPASGAISGHSMGGHGALILRAEKPRQTTPPVSAFSGRLPIQ